MPRNPEKHKASRKRWRERNKEHVQAYGKKWRQENPEYAKEAYSRWYSSNKEKVAAKTAARQAAKDQRTPPWADLELISVFYALAKDMTEETGVEHHVDHIIPLRGDIVSGLHVPTNLQVIPACENLSKGNSYA